MRCVYEVAPWHIAQPDYCHSVGFSQIVANIVNDFKVLVEEISSIH